MEPDPDSLSTPSRVDFYILTSADPAARALFAARLAEKAWRRGQRVAILAPDQATASHLDTLLWEFRPDAFLPHDVAIDSAPAVPPPVLISGDPTLLRSQDVLINLGHQSSEQFETFRRIAEIVIQQPDLLAESRRRYKQYRTCGFEVHTHRLE